MKIRNPKVIRGVSWLGTMCVRGWMGTVRFREHTLGQQVNPKRIGPGERYIYMFWHETMMLLLFQFRNSGVRVLISQHADGEMIAQACTNLGFTVARGSTTRQGAEGLLDMVRSARTSSLAVTPDGPRGPRRRVQQGVAFLAAMTGLPIAPIGIAYDRCWRANNWDRFAVPRPFSTGYTVTGALIRVPASAVRSREAIEVYRQRIEQSMLEATAWAEHWASTGGAARPPAVTPPAPVALAG